MKKKPKIKISEKAYNELSNMINSNSEYDYVRFVYNPKCCGIKIDIILDNYKSGDIIDNVDKLNILYSASLSENISEITLIFNNSGFMIKNTAYDYSKITHTCSDSKNKDCGGCSSKKCSKSN